MHRPGNPTAAVLLALVLACACSPTPGPSPRRATLQGLTDEVFLPMVDAVEARAADLSARSQQLCDTPSEASLQSARDAWHDARERMKQAEVLGFGPHSLPPWRLAGQLDFWPARPESIEAALSEKVAMGADAGLSLGAAEKGLPAIEYLLFGPRSTPDDFASEPQRCDYLLALCEDLERQAGRLNDAWRDSFVDELLIAPGTERYATIGKSFEEVVNSLVATVEIVRLDKIGRPFGLKAGGEVQPQELESRFAPRSLRDAIDTLRGVDAVFHGRYERHRTGGLSDMLRQAGRPKDAQFTRNMEAAVEALESIPAPLERALTREKPAVEAALEELRQLQVFLQVDLTQALAVTVTFGGSDGD